jgi:hypothetical protein
MSLTSVAQIMAIARMLLDGGPAAPARGGDSNVRLRYDDVQRLTVRDADVKGDRAELFLSQQMNDPSRRGTWW